MSLVREWIASLEPPADLKGFLDALALAGEKPGDSDDPAEFMKDLLVEVEFLAHTAKGWDDFLSSGELSKVTDASPRGALLYAHARMSEAGELDGPGAAVFADAYQKLGKVEAARVAALAAFSLGTNTVGILGILFNLALETGRLEVGGVLCSWIFHASPDGPEAPYCRARLADAAGDTSGAASQAMVLAESFPGYRPAWLLAATGLAKLGEWLGLIDLLERLPQRFAGDRNFTSLRSRALLNLALMSLKARNFQDAVELAGAVIAIDPELAPHGWLVASDALRFAGAPAEARSALEEALRAAPGDAQILGEAQKRLSQSGWGK